MYDLYTKGIILNIIIYNDLKRQRLRKRNRKIYIISVFLANKKRLGIEKL